MQAMAEDRGAPSATAAAAGHDSGEQQWAYIPTTTVSAEITVEPMDTAGGSMMRSQFNNRCYTA